LKKVAAAVSVLSLVEISNLELASAVYVPLASNSIYNGWFPALSVDIYTFANLLWPQNPYPK